MQTRRDVFQAIADPTRRQIISLIARKSLNLNSIAENFEMSRPAISQHIKILSECGLIIIRQKGRERICEARLQRLDKVTHWVEQNRKFWTAKLDDLERFLDTDEIKTQKSTKPKKSKRNEK